MRQHEVGMEKCADKCGVRIIDSAMQTSQTEIGRRRAGVGNLQLT